MTWAEFKTAVKVLLTVDAQRLNVADFIEQHTRAAVIDLLHFIPFYRKDYVRTMLPADFVTEQFASRGQFPAEARVTSVDILRRVAPATMAGEGCVNFTDGSAYLNDTSAYPDLSSGPITFECSAYIAAADTLSPHRYLCLFDDETKMFALSLANESGVLGHCKLKAVLNFPIAPITLKSVASIVPDRWNHFAMVWDKGEGRLLLYINGRMNASCVTSESRLVPSATPQLRIGLQFKGKLDEVKLWNATRTKEHFSLRFNQWSGSIEPNLIAYFRFNDRAVNAPGDYTPDFIARVATAGVQLNQLRVLDGVQTVENDRILVENYITAADNGIYSATSSTWPRTSDANESAEFTNGKRVFVTEGTVRKNSTWEIGITANPFTLGTDSITFTNITANTPTPNAIYRAKNEVTGELISFNSGLDGWEWSTEHYPIIDTSTTAYSRYPCVDIAWGKRQFLINNMVSLNDQNGRVAIAPNGCRFYLYPLIKESDDQSLQMLAEVSYDTDAIVFDDLDIVPYDEPMIACVADWVKGELARHVRHDLTEYASYLQKPGQASRQGGSYYQKRIQLFYRAKERGRINDDGEAGGPYSQGPRTGADVVPAITTTPAVVNNYYTVTGSQTYVGAFTDPNGHVAGKASVHDRYKSLASLGGDGQEWVKVTGEDTKTGWE